ncbi:4-hydroxybenzoate octaprenyltransferase [Oecophyllibacter saccharovorans]|nr:4-hydroxybenzoate octaprenyltransferase [Oecophyllibacter saccharovorans]
MPSMPSPSPADAPHTDLRHNGWIRHLPPSWRPYALLARLDRPVGCWLLFLPGVYGLFLPAGVSDAARWKDVVLFAIGAVLMRSAGCVVNDIWDRKIDARVSRTANRPLASGALSLRQAFFLLAVLLLGGLAVLLQLPPICWALTPLALVLVALYPTAKRFTWWPQLIMGITFGFGAPMGYAAAHGTLDVTGLLLYGGVILWQLGFDTVYGFQDMEDDARIGVKSTSRLMVGHARLFVTLCYAGTLALFSFCALRAHLAGFFWIFFSAAALWLLWQGTHLTPCNPRRCLQDFRNNVPIGMLFALAFIAGRLGHSL